MSFNKLVRIGYGLEENQCSPRLTPVDEALGLELDKLGVVDSPFPQLFGKIVQEVELAVVSQLPGKILDVGKEGVGVFGARPLDIVSCGVATFLPIHQNLRLAPCGYARHSGPYPMGLR